jgi:hypothetical protein
MEEGEKFVGMLVVKGGVWNGPPMCVDCMINTVMIKEWAFLCDVLWGAKVGTAGAGSGFGWIHRMEPLSI